jgi:hypothetical protein
MLSVHMRKGMTHVRIRLRTLRVVVAWAAAGMACSGTSTSSSPTTPSTGVGTGGAGTGGTCRTYATSGTEVGDGTSAGTSMTFTASFNPSTNQFTTTSLFASGGLCSTGVYSYSSSTDFVNEVRVIPPLTLATGLTFTQGGTCGSGTAHGTYSYDSQRRVTRFLQDGLGSVTSYSAWDSAGRPTTGVQDGVAFTDVYSDAARTLTFTSSSAGMMISIYTQTYDANGNLIRVSNAGGSDIYTVTSTGSVCK